MTCSWCEEPILPGEKTLPNLQPPAHVPCGVRMMVGSLAHVEGRCGCFVEGSEEGDPLGITKRQAAEAAAMAYLQARDDEIERRAKLEIN